jgi:UDP-glucose 4-epimerase
MFLLVTGGCGFIGSHLVEALVRRGDTVRVIDNLVTGHPENIAAVRDNVEVFQNDILDPGALARAAQGAEAVIHLAAQVSVPDSIERPLNTHAQNATGVLAVLEAARKAGARRVVFSSSCAVYGNAPGLPKHEDMPPCPESPYAVTKLMGEFYLSVYASLHGMETVSLRYFNVFGPRQDPSSVYSGVISRFTDCFRTGKRPTVYGDGLQTRDFVYVADVVRANLLALEAREAGKGEVFNIGAGRTATLLDILEAFRRHTGKDLHPVHEPARAGEVRHSLADITRAREVLGYTPRHGVSEGIAAIVTEA